MHHRLFAVFAITAIHPSFQLDGLRSLHEEVMESPSIEDNFRPIQPINDRTISRSFTVDSDNSNAAALAVVCKLSLLVTTTICAALLSQ